jgi:putative acetyltransferase
LHAKILRVFPCSANSVCVRLLSSRGAGAENALVRNKGRLPHINREQLLMIIRSEQQGDEAGIRDVNLKAFATDAEANLVDALRQAGIELISLVAEENAKLVGHILFSPVDIDGYQGAMALAPMAVLPDRQNKGIGTQLVEAGLKACKAAGYNAVIVLGHPGYYPRFGFQPALNSGITSEYDVPSEVFMVKELHKDALKGVTGTVVYHPAFNSAS